MIEHMVLVKFTEDVTELQKEELIQKSMGLKAKIPGILDLQQGLNFSQRNQGYEYGVTIRFENKEALESFDSHPKHLEVVSYLRQIGLEDIVVVDFEVNS